jgi:hypothetical protein
MCSSSELEEPPVFIYTVGQENTVNVFLNNISISTLLMINISDVDIEWRSFNLNILVHTAGEYTIKFTSESNAV